MRRRPRLAAAILAVVLLAIAMAPVVSAAAPAVLVPLPVLFGLVACGFCPAPAPGHHSSFDGFAPLPARAPPA